MEQLIDIEEINQDNLVEAVKRLTGVLQSVAEHGGDRDMALLDGLAQLKEQVKDGFARVDGRMNEQTDLLRQIAKNTRK